MMENGAYDVRRPDMLAAWQQALAEVPPTPALSGALRRRADLFGRFAAWYGRLRRRPRAEQRRWQRQLGLSLAGIALLLAMNGAPAGAVGPAAIITVTDSTGTLALNGLCSLPEAIINANNDAATHPDCAAGGGADIIDLQTNVTLTAVNNTTDGNNGLPVITSAITIEGNGNTISRSSATAFRILAVASGGNLTLNSATVSGGAASGTIPSITDAGGGIFNLGALTVSNSTLSGNSAFFYGGGIFNGAGATLTVQSSSVLSGNSATLVGGGIVNAATGTATVQSSTLSGNSATNGNGGGIYNSGALTVQNSSTLSGNSAAYGDGGGISNRGTLTVQSNSILSENSAGQDGGGIFNYSGVLTVSNSTLSANSAGTYGGGIYNSATLTISNSTFSVNSAAYGGGIWNAFTLTISNSTLSGNSATNRGGGIYSGAGGTVTVSNSTLSGNSATNGGGIDNIATLTVLNSTLSGNSTVTSGSNGGGINNRNTLTVLNSTLSGNSATNGGGIFNDGTVTVTVQNSTLSGNSATSGGGIRNDGTLTVSNSTLSGNSAAFGGGIRNGGPLTMQNSTLSGNSANVGGGINNGGALTALSSIVAAQTGSSTDCAGSPIASGGYNIESGNTCGFTGTGDLQNVPSGSLALGALANNGGPTQTMALGLTSVAVDHIPVGALEANGCGTTVTTDQRGLPRASGATAGGPRCDVGAFEVQVPLAVTLASFDAQAMLDHIQLSWETVSEMNNAGFNLYRSASPVAPEVLLAFMPSQAPGSTQGASYSFDDTEVAPGETWYYWLEDVDLSGATSLHGPVSATLQAPTAVTVAALQADAANPASVTPWGAMAAALIAAAGVLGVRRRSRAR